MESVKRKLDESDDSDIIEIENNEETKTSDIEKPICKYGSKCYRKNPEHLKEYSHPKKEDSDTSSVELDENVGKSSKMIKLSTDLNKNYIYFSKVENVANASKINGCFSLSLNDILSKNKDEFLESAQFNYMHDLNWLIDQYPKENRTKPLTIIHGNSKKTELDELAEVYTHVKLVKAKLDSPYGTHHTKMMFLLYKSGMRVVIHTANLIEMDWEKKTQGIWISEKFPRIPEGKSSKASNIDQYDSKTKFKSYLLTYLEHYKEDKLNNWINHIKGHDMSSANVFLIGSVPGRFPATKKIFGHVRLRKILSDNLKIETESDKSDQIVCQFSSIGSLGPSEDKWLCKEFSSSLSSSKNSNLPKTSKPILIYPSVEDVAKSFEGFLAGTSLPYSNTVASKQPYLKNFFYRWKANKYNRTRASPHIKSFARYSHDFSKLYWFILTSANLSKAAWGSFEKNESQYHILSYEIGVLFIPSFLEDEQKEFFNLNENPEFLVPYDLPPEKYNDKDKPWIVDYLLNL